MLFSICPEMMYPTLKLEAKIARVAKEGFGYIDIWDWRDKDASEFGRQLKNHGVKLNAFCGHMDSSTSIAKEKAGFLEELRGSIRFAQRFECNRMMVFSDGIQDPIPDTDPPVMPAKPNLIAENQKVKNMTEAFEDAVELAEKADVYLLLEALNNYDHPEYFINNSTKALQMVRRIGSKRLKMLYDIYHMQLSEGNIVQTVSKNLSDIGYIHFADAPGRHEPGTGELNFSFIMERLKDADFRGGVGFEFVSLAKDEDALSSTRRQIDRFIGGKTTPPRSG